MNDKALVKKYSDISLKMLALLTGTVIFFPSIFNFIHPPYIWNIYLYLFWALSILAICFHIVSFYLSAYASQAPHICSGLGNFSAILAIIAFSIFSFSNIVEDKSSLPVISSMDATPGNPNPGEIVVFHSEVKDQDEDEINYMWKVFWKDKHEQFHEEYIGKKKNSSWLIPDKIDAGFVYSILSIRDDHEQAVTDTLKVFINKSNMNEVSQFLLSRIERQIDVLVTQNKVQVAKDLESIKIELANHAAEYYNSLQEVKMNETNITFALRKYVQYFAPSQFAIRFPCCSKYPGIFPFCKREC